MRGNSGSSLISHPQAQAPSRIRWLTSSTRLPKHACTVSTCVEMEVRLVARLVRDARASGVTCASCDDDTS
eukprot:1263217-Prymnesium_polylepis.1